jgi:hypothetical protein
MKPAELTAASFSIYPAAARAFAQQYLSVLQMLPLPLAVTVLREVSTYDWRFPAERRTLQDQLAWLRSLSGDDRAQVLHGFAQLTLPAETAAEDWVGHPQQFSEKMTAELWATHQIDAFRTAASDYATAWRTAFPEPMPVTPRLGIVVLGTGVRGYNYPLFRKLRPHGVFFAHVDPRGGMEAIFNTVSGRIARSPSPYEHWYIDGGSREPSNESGLTGIDWDGLEPVRNAILQRMQTVIASPSGGPEKLQTVLASTTPADVGMALDKDEVLGRFAISVLTEGSGTQIFSTTFAQWATREALRRAQPCTLVVRFTLRQRQLPMDELLSGKTNQNIPDPEGSLIDADMGAFYTWIDQQRLTGAAQASFIAWSQERNEAVAIGPGFPRGAVGQNPVTVQQLLEQ